MVPTFLCSSQFVFSRQTEHDFACANLCFQFRCEGWLQPYAWRVLVIICDAKQESSEGA